ncbi:NmrA family NAD(P)-binding protein [Streptomyces sp. GC420]|uniref:NmrA family NAD(P)-binding protein n=1 Tax=Streptomyces sp. GC420 TaxID=2697568 RepID=UPI0014152F2B|nr:NmrA family NAD(P)-binding protein [Streptomyces sp. GC420]NBM18393.1 NAD(P)H-binding protein [Streptomyces sp. GC420]
MTQTDILVLGSTGKTGRRVVQALRARGASVRAAGRSAEVRFDWNDDRTWEPALTGARAVYVVDRQDQPGEWDAEAEIGALAKLAVDRGVGRIVLLQARTTGLVGGKDLSAGVRGVRESGAEWTALRPNWFFQNFDEGVLLDSVRSGELRLPAGDGHEPFVDAGDVAEVAAAALLDDGHSGQVYELSGGRAFSMEEAAAEISKATGRTVAYVPVSHEAYVRELVSYDVPADYALFVADLVGQIRDNLNSAPTDTVERVLGRPPRDFADFVRDAAARGAWTV